MMMLNNCMRALVLAASLLAVPGPALAQLPAQEGFVPVDQLPDQESMPAAPLVAAAYAVAWLAILIYLLSVWKRLGTVERELAEVSRRIDARGGS
jgi:CcmD family protein